MLDHGAHARSLYVVPNAKASIDLVYLREDVTALSAKRARRNVRVLESLPSRPGEAIGPDPINFCQNWSTSISTYDYDEFAFVRHMAHFTRFK